MTVLAIDAGNSRIKWGLFADGAWQLRGALETSAVGEFAQALAAVPIPRHIVIANVAGATVRDGIEAALARFAVPVDWVVSVPQQCGVRSGYADPSQLGADRWAALVAARERYATACVVVMAGTTVTVDALSSEGVCLGGCIVPGIALMQQSLADSTAQLHRRDGHFLFFPDNTADAIVSGAVNAIAGAVDRIARYMREAGEPDPLVVLSGGAAAVLAPQLSGRVEAVDNLVLDGLLRIGLDGGEA